MTGADRVEVYVSAGSNIEPVKNLRLACSELEESSGLLSRSSVYRTKSVGFEGNDFLNMVIRFSSPLSLDDIICELERIEKLSDRRRESMPFASRTLDLDLLLYGDQVVRSPQVSLPRADITKYAFVLGPMAEMAPGLRHPQSGKTMGELWAAFDQGAQPIQRLEESPLI